MHRLAPFLAFFVVAAGCSAVPSLDDATGTSSSRGASDHSKNAVFIADVTRRIKCELAASFDERLGLPHTLQRSSGAESGDEIPTWLADWTVKADLTLQANEQGDISPSGSYTKFRRSAVNTAAGPTASPGTALGTVQQFFSLSLTANAGEQAERTEVLSFNVGLKELKTWSRGAGAACVADAQQGLLGNLGIREWIDASLGPVNAGVLQAGKHPAPTTAATAAKPNFVSKPTSLASANLFDAASSFSAAPSATQDKIASSLREQKFPEDFVDALEKSHTPADIAIGAQALSATDKDKFVHIVKTQTPPSDADKAALTLAESQVNVAATTAQNSLDAILANAKALHDKMLKAQEMQQAYDGISTPQSIKQLLAQRQTIQKYYDSVVNASHCALQQLCGEGYGSCGDFTDAEGQHGRSQ
jgi:hypothetical protein